MSKRITATRAKRATPANIDQGQKIWLAGLGAVAVAQREGSKAFELLVGEGKRLQASTDRVVRDVQHQASAIVSKRVKPVRAQFTAIKRDVEASLERSLGRVLSYAGIPSKADVDALIVRVDRLSRQLRASK